LANGHAQGIENGSIVRFDPNVSSGNSRVAGFLPGDRALPPAARLPNRLRADGSFIVLVNGPFLPNLAGGLSESIGLVRLRADGSRDPGFGTGGATMPSAADVIGLGQAAGPGMTVALDPVLNIDDDVFGDGNRLSYFDTLELSDGTFVTVASVRTQNHAFRPTSILLLRWDANGKPLGVTQWGGRAARWIPYYLGGRHLGGEAMSWRPTCAALLPDGSIAVALEASDWRLVPSSQTGPTVDPASLPRLAGLCRLVPPAFILDTSMN